jgi:hypothetical protein
MFKLLTITRKSSASQQEKSQHEGMSTNTDGIVTPVCFGQNDEEVRSDPLSTPLQVLGWKKAKVNPWLFLRMPKPTKSQKKLERTIDGGHRSQNASWGNANLGQMPKPSATSSRLQNALRSDPSSAKVPDLLNKLLTARSSQRSQNISLVSSLFYYGRYQQPSNKALTTDTMLVSSSSSERHLRMRRTALAPVDEDSPTQ